MNAISATVVTKNHQRSHWRSRAVTAGLLFVILWLFASWLAVDQLTSRASPIHDEPVPTQRWAHFQTIRLITADGQELGAWFLPGQSHQPPVILLHGNGGSRGDCLDQAEWLAEAGYPLLLITQRAHGDSTGDRNDFGYSARADVIAGVDWLQENNHGRPVVWGRSLGSAAALFASQELGHRVRGYVLECPYRDLRTAVHNRLERRLPPLLRHFAYGGLCLVAPLVLGDIDRISPEEASAGVPDDLPVLILAGGHDQHATPAEAQAIARRIGAHAELVVFEGAEHLSLARQDPVYYRETALRFLSSIRSSP